jgi:hypothetical protein
LRKVKNDQHIRFDFVDQNQIIRQLHQLEAE